MSKNVFSRLFSWSLWGVVAVLATTGIAVATSLFFFPLENSKLDMLAGEATFDARCSGCHSKFENQASGLGPNLYNIGELASSRVDGQNGAEYLLESIFYPDRFIAPGSGGHMPSGTADDLSDAEIRNLVAYLGTLGARADYAETASLNIVRPEATKAEENYTVAEMREGWHLFSQGLGCMACHSIYSEPGASLVAPSLEKASQLPKDYVLESIKDPSAHIPPAYVQSVFVLENGDRFTGRLHAEKEDSYLVYGFGPDGNRKLHRLEKSMVSTIESGDISPMPPYQLTAEQERALLAFVNALQGPGN